MSMVHSKIKIPIFKGINQTYPEIDMSYAAAAENIDISDGILKVCKGIKKKTLIQTQNNIKTLIKLCKRNSGVYEEILLAATDSDIYVWSQNGYYGIKTDLTSGKFAYINYQLDGEDICILTNGEDTPFYTNGIYCTDMADVPKFTQVVLHYERMWGCGVAGYPDRVYYSVSFDPTDFSTLGESGFIDIPSFDGNPVLALDVLFDDVVVFKKDSLYRIIGTYPDTYEVSKIHGVVGPIAPDTIVNTGSLVLFLSGQGLCAYDGVKASLFKSHALKNFTARINKTAIDQAVSTVYNGTVLIALPLDGATENNAVLEYDTVRDTFTVKKGFCVNSFVALDDILLISDNTKYIKIYGDGDTFDGALINAYWETPFTDAGDRSVVKYLDMLYAFGKGDAVKVTVVSEHESKERTYALNSVEEAHIKLPLQGKGVRFKLRFENVDGGYFELIAPEVHFEKDI